MGKQHCVHYSVEPGFEPRCARGIPIRVRFKPKWPCWTGNKPPEASAACPFFLAPTPEQLAEREREGSEAVTRVLKAIAAIEAWEQEHGKKSRQIVTIACPCCQVADGLRFYRTASHLYAECSTPKCVNVRGSFGR